MPDYKSPLGLLDYLVPDSLEKEVITGFARPLTEQQLAKEDDAQRKARLTQYGSFRPNIDPNNPQGLSNLETLLGYAVAPQFFETPTNRQMIDASILRAGLELMKPNQPGENTASALLRSLDQAGQPAKTLADYKLAQAAARAKGMRPQVQDTGPKIFAFKNVAKNLHKNNAVFREQVKELTGKGWLDFENPVVRALAANAISYQSEYGGTIENAILMSGNRMEQLSTGNPDTSTKLPNTDNTKLNPKSVVIGKPNIPGIKIK